MANFGKLASLARLTSASKNGRVETRKGAQTNENKPNKKLGIGVVPEMRQLLSLEKPVRGWQLCPEVNPLREAELHLGKNRPS